MSTNELQSKIREVKEYQRLMEEMETIVDGLKDEIKAEMKALGAQELTAGEYKVRYAEVKSSRFDSKAFKEKYSELYNQFVKENVTLRFTIA